MILVRPTVGRVTSKFGFRNHPIKKTADFHTGIDYGHKTLNDEVVSITDGTVRIVRNNEGGYGLYVVVDHGRFHSLYAHLKNQKVSEGQKVSAGDLLGIKGTTGMSKGVHTHFEIRVCDYADFWDKYPSPNDDNWWKHAVDPEKFFLENELELCKQSKENNADIPDWAVEPMKWGIRLGLNDGIVQNPTELQTLTMLYKYHRKVTLPLYDELGLIFDDFI